MRPKADASTTGHETVAADSLQQAIDATPVKTVDLQGEVVPRARIELATLRFSVVCSTN
jgi:hypothetical protein